MQPYANPRPNNLWTTRNIMIIILVGVLSILFLMFPLFKYYLPVEVFRTDQDIGNIYHREAFFLRNYEAMERDFKIFVYPDGKSTTCYNPKDEHKSKYASEYYFLKNLNTSSFLTDDPAKAHLFFIPFSCRERGGNEDVLKNYVKALITSPYWKRTLGADHFFFSCHDSVSRATEEIPIVMKNAIRLVCSPSYDSKYIPHKDVSLPQTWELSLPPDHGDDVWSRSTVESRAYTLSPNEIPPRTKLAFWAGSPDSEVRRYLRIFHKGAPEFDFHFIHTMQSPAELGAYYREIYRSKFCVCPRGRNQLGGVCLTESMIFGCIPVVLSDYYDLPFNHILDWKKFSVIIKENDVPDLDEILNGLPKEKYEKMHQNVLQVSKHFRWNSPPVKYDLFHLVMYELWLRHRTVLNS